MDLYPQAENHVSERTRSCLSLDLRPKLKTTFLRELDPANHWINALYLKTTFLSELGRACHWIYALS